MTRETKGLFKENSGKVEATQEIKDSDLYQLYVTNFRGFLTT